MYWNHEGANTHGFMSGATMALCLVVQWLHQLKLISELINYRIEGTFQGRKFSRLIFMKIFHELNFEDCL